jgi:hypothetical protein
MSNAAGYAVVSTLLLIILILKLFHANLVHAQLLHHLNDLLSTQMNKILTTSSDGVIYIVSNYEFVLYFTLF